MSATVLLIAAAVEGVLLAVLLSLLLVERTLDRARTRREPAVFAARAALVGAVHDQAPDLPALAALRALRAPEALRLLIELADTVSGRARVRLLDLAEQAGLPAKARRLCASRSWARRLRGIRALSRLHAHDDHVIAVLLGDRVGAVVAAAADGVDQGSDSKLFKRLVGLLDDKRPQCRFAAKAALAAAGGAATPTLVAYLQSTDCPCPADALEAATGGVDLRLLPVALCRTGDPDPLVRARATALLGALGSMSAADRLQALLTDPNCDVRAAAARGLGRLGEWAPARQVARLLEDPHWEVRRAAALALNAMGAPGRLYLREAAAGQEGAAAQAARYVLVLPANAIDTLLV